MSERIYKVGDRNKLPRNKWGLINDGTVIAKSQLFGSDAAAAGGVTGTNIISLEMVDLTDFKGASVSEDGERGLVPQPLIKQRNWFLKGGGDNGLEKWSRIPAADWLYEWPKSEGLTKQGLGIDGDFHVGNTLTTMNLEVEGAAHFWTLIIDEVKASGGAVLVSPSTFRVDYIGEVVKYYVWASEEDLENNQLMQLLHARTDVYNLMTANNVEYVRCRRLYQKCDDGEKRVENKCIIGDMMRCRSFNLQKGTYRNVSNTDYWTFVCNGGEGSFTDTEGNTYDAIYIDIAFALTTADNNIIPLGSTLYEDHVEYPEGFEPYVADDLIEITADVWNGDRTDIELQVFENEEWTSIQENVIDIRGFDEQLEDITGEPSTRKIYTSEMAAAESQFESSVNGLSTDTNNRRAVDVAQTILDNGIGTDSSTEFEDSEGLTISNEVLGYKRSISLRDGLTITRVNENNIVLPKNAVTERDFIAAEILYNQNGELVYDKNATIPSGTTVLDNWRVIDNSEVNNATTIVDNVEVPVSESDKQQIDDITFNTPSDMTRDVDYRFNTNYNEITSWRFGYVSDWRDFRIKPDDNLVCLGHLYDETRQNAILLVADLRSGIDQELKAPYISQYSRIDTFGESISKFRQTAIAANGNEFIGSFFVNYNGRYLDINERINLFITDIKTGLEKVGIHLDGDNSTITLVGNVELKQHGNDSYDSLSVFDSLNQKRVEIIPEPIPERESVNNPIQYTKYNFNTIYDKKNAPEQYIQRIEEKRKKSLFNYYYQYTYILDGYNLNYKLSADLGYFSKHDRLTLSNLYLTLKCPTYFNGTEYVQIHGEINFQDTSEFITQKQFINKLKYTIRANGVDANNVGFNVPVVQVDIPYTANGLIGDNINVSSTNTILDNIEIPFSANYSIDIDIEYNVYAFIQLGTKYNNYYYTIDSSASGSLSTYITRDKIKQDGVDVPLGKMTIGTNGFTFYNNNTKFFYAGEDGYELKWGDLNELADITLDDTYGIRITKPMLTIDENSSHNIGVKYEIISCTRSSSAITPYTIELPSISDYGEGRRMTICSSFLGLNVHFNDSIFSGSIPISNNTITFATGGAQVTMEILSTRVGWMLVSYV